jgi:hypothetical protein
MSDDKPIELTKSQVEIMNRGEYASDLADQTTFLNDKWMTFLPVAGKPIEAFNALYKIPDHWVDLGDGREMGVREWHPRGDMETVTNTSIRVKAEFVVRVKENKSETRLEGQDDHREQR